jgi:hypothetical protein
MMKRFLLAAIRAYQALSRSGTPNPMLFGAYSGCRSWPTCSDYAVAIIEQDGVVRGGIKAIGRVLRCNPLTVPKHL